MNSDPSDEHEHDSDQPPDFLPVDDKSSRNLIGSATDALLTMVNNIAANVLGAAPESTAGAGNSSAESLNMTEVVFPAGSIHSAAYTGPADQLDVIGITETASITEETTATLSDAAGVTPVQTTPDVEQVVTLLLEDEPHQSSGGHLEPEADHRKLTERSAFSRSHRVSLQEYLMQRCSSPDLLQTRTTNPTIMTPSKPTESPVILPRDPEDLAPSLTSDLLRLVSADSSRATRPIELTCASASECLTETPPRQSESSQKPDLTSASAAQTGEDQVSLDIPAPTASINTADESSVSALVDEAVSSGSPAQAVHPSEGLSGSESRNKELIDDESSAHIEQIDTEAQNSSDAHAHGSSQKESVFMRLNNRIKVLEMNMSLSGRYLEQLSQRYRKQVEEMQRAFNKTIIKLQNTSRMSEEQDQRQTDSIQALQAQLENVMQLVLSLSVSVSQLQREVSERQSYILLCLVLCVLLGLLICVNYRQISESPAVVSQSSCCPDREPSDDEAVLLRRRASDPPSLSSLQTPDKETSSCQQWEHCAVNRHQKKPKVKLSRGPETLSADRFPHTTVGPLGLETDGRDVMSDGSSEGSSQADETLFCGISTCARLCEALPAPKRWTQSRSQHQPPQCSVPPPAIRPANLNQTGLKRLGDTGDDHTQTLTPSLQH